MRIAGVDEVGRGPLAGPVLAAAVILNPAQPIVGLADSKLLTEAQREDLYQKIIENSLAYAVGRAEVSEIDRLNILQASLLAMQRAIHLLTIQPDQVLVDGNQLPCINIPAHAIVKGDQKIPAISAASIVAKVTRDREMILLDEQYPGYGFAAHKGYATREHLRAIKLKGVTSIHRMSFAPVYEKVLQMELEII